MGEYVDIAAPYRAAKADADPDPEPGGFRIAGQQFDTVTVLTPVTLLDFAVLTERNRLAALMQFLEASLLPESWTRFDQLLHDPDHTWVVDCLEDIVDAVIGRLTGRPTTPPSRSAAGSSSSGKKSKGGSRSPAAGLRSA